MSPSSTVSVRLVTSCRDLSVSQGEFISLKGPDSGNRTAVEKFTKQFGKEFGIKIPWRAMRRFITSIQRKKRRNGGENASLKTTPPFTRFSIPICSANNRSSMFY